MVRLGKGEKVPHAQNTFSISVCNNINTKNIGASASVLLSFSA